MSEAPQRFWKCFDDDGQIQYVTRRPPNRKGDPAPIEVDRLPERHERWEGGSDGRWVIDRDALIDEQHRGQHGAAAIAEAHLIKVVEARLLLAGYAFDGLVTAEAAAAGVDVDRLARAIVENAEPATSAELDRRRAKLAARAGD